MVPLPYLVSDPTTGPSRNSPNPLNFFMMVEYEGISSERMVRHGTLRTQLSSWCPKFPSRPVFQTQIRHLVTSRLSDCRRKDVAKQRFEVVADGKTFTRR